MTEALVGVEVRLCRQCGSSRLSSRGPIPSTPYFSGQRLERALAGGQLLVCEQCAVVLRMPCPSIEDLSRLYGALPSGCWASDGPRIDQFLTLRQLRKRFQTADVLDVGCYDGTLLAGLNDDFRRFGIEPSRSAAAIAEAKGIEVVGDDYTCISRLGRQFDAILAVDVIEHVQNPLSFVSTLASGLKTGGVLIVSTGNASVPSWRLAGGQYWYCTLGEHISFVSPAWAHRAAPSCGLKLDDVEYFAYGGESLSPGQRMRMTRDFFIAVLKARVRRAVGPLWPSRANGSLPTASFGVPGLFRDHVILVMQK